MVTDKLMRANLVVWADVQLMAIEITVGADLDHYGITDLSNTEQARAELVDRYSVNPDMVPPHVREADFIPNEAAALRAHRAEGLVMRAEFRDGSDAARMADHDLAEMVERFTWWESLYTLAV